jgi:type IV pilus assembly protein PilO
MNANLEKIFKLPTAKKVTVWVLVLLLIALGFYFLLIKSKQEEVKDLQTRLGDLKTQLNENRKIAANLPILTKEYNQLNEKLEKALSELPNQKEIPALLTSITDAGKRSGLDFLVFKPKSESPKDFYAEVPIDITVSGSYHSVTKFFSAVSELPRIVNISNVSISDINSKSGNTNLKVTCLATTFRFLDKKELKDDKKAKK